MQDEATEDIERMAAINPTEESYFKTSDFKHAKNRIFLAVDTDVVGGGNGNYFNKI
mgnify:CR=1 FL=1